MGRRAKNKQGDPEPISQDRSARPSGKRLGKRKAEADVDAKDGPSKRPAKKAREHEEKSSRKEQNGGKTGSIAKEIKKAASKPKVKRKAQEESEGESSSEGWEGVRDDDIKAPVKYVVHLVQQQLLKQNVRSGPSFMIAKTRVRASSATWKTSTWRVMRTSMSNI